MKAFLNALLAVLMLQAGLLLHGADAPVSAAAKGDDDWNPSMLRPGDVLSIEVFRVSEFSRSVRIEDDGSFTYPLCGEIRAAGQTPRDIARVMEKKLALQIANPQVEVTVSCWSPRRVYVLGEVRNSSSLELPTYGRMTVLQAISEAGGVTESADLNNVVVLRRTTGENGVSKLERFKVDVSVLSADDRTSQVPDFRLRPEDTLVVPKAQPVFITGEIKASVEYIDTQKPPLVSELVIRCGGLLNGADPSHIQIVRQERDGTTKLLTASLAPVAGGPYERDMRVAPGDYIMVPAQEQIYVLGEVKDPGPLILPPNKKVTASQAIALAGGFTPVARQGKVTLIRGNKMQYLDLAKLYDEIENLRRDVDLLPGDIVFVRQSFW